MTTVDQANKQGRVRIAMLFILFLFCKIQMNSLRCGSRGSSGTDMVTLYTTKVSNATANKGWKSKMRNKIIRKISQEIK